MNAILCSQCGCDYCYYDGIQLVCPECGHEWQEIMEEEEEAKVLDANGAILQDGDSVILIKALKLKGSSQSIKQGTKVKNIRLVPDGDHNIDCKIDGVGMMLKSKFVKKA
ncbi:zinc ribbon domain-containing protein YjdM [Suttonella ornithocola]|uniref:Putative alkylphosphonate utilization operon protein PhnA n=1 Tax=Suttonella ornithocola TaxID=279832 RepID=A0A380MTZ9_9GAMM|nr:zinc ribbon domain-containing protein YjdM [Suttonella ornithocola]SUO95748.1 putative alkylphosphonate utilization operon protein PhnA [Suttonella ornithocola]